MILLKFLSDAGGNVMPSHIGSKILNVLFLIIIIIIIIITTIKGSVHV